MWRVEYSPQARKELKALDRPTATRIIQFIEERIINAEDPRSNGAALRGPELGKYWKYRVGDYRIVCQIFDSQVLVQVIRIGNRKEVYR